MPFRDKTGPLGLGAKTGLGLGRCRDSKKNLDLLKQATKTRSITNSPWFWSVMIPVGAVVVKDLTGQNSILKRLAGQAPKLLSNGVKGLLKP